jgi:hypothetical protein
MPTEISLTFLSFSFHIQSLVILPSYIILPQEFGHPLRGKESKIANQCWEQI